MGQGEVDRDLLSRFRAWFPDQSEEQQRFMVEGLVVLDTNVLLNLYRLAPHARDDVLDALEKVAEEDRLWLPHQAGLEFVRNRRTAVVDRNKRLQKTLDEIRKAFDSAVAQVVGARRTVQKLIEDTERDAVALQDLDQLISERAVADAVKGWRADLVARVKALQETHDIDPDSLREGDPLLDRINVLFGGRIGAPLPEQETASLVQHFVDYRSPNQIPPGFDDAGAKSTALLSAGDYLMWEQIIRHAKMHPPASRLLLLVTDELKIDWRGPDRQPRPELADELWRRADVVLRVETTKDFLEGVEKFLGVSVSEDTYAEVARVAVTEDTEEIAPDEVDSESSELPEAIDEDNVDTVDPGRLAREAVKASGLLTLNARESVEQDRSFGWWLVGVTAAQGLREPAADEPVVRLRAAVLSLSDEPPASGWEQERLRVGQGIRNVWVAPWLAWLLRSLPSPDPNRLRRLAGRQLTLELESAESVGQTEPDE